MRKIPLQNNFYYHIYNRGVDKRDIFQDKKDIERFLFSMEVFQHITPIRNLRDSFFASDVRNLGKLEEKKKEKLVSIVEYCINPNHFHMVLKQNVDGGISEFMKRLSGGYTKYFNEKYQRSGSLFQGTFKSSLMDNDNYFSMIIIYVMWNYKVHDIPQNKLMLVKSSEDEYRNGNFKIVDEKEGKHLLEMVGGFDKLKKQASETINLIRTKRGKESRDFFEYDED